MNNILNDIQNWYNVQKVEEANVQILIGILVFIVSIVLSSFLSYLFIKLFNIKNKDKKIKKSAFYKPLKVFFILIGFYIAVLILKLPNSLMDIINKFVRIITILLIANGISNIVSPKSIIFEKILKNEKYKDNKASLLLVSKIVKVVVYIIATFIIISEFGYNLNGIVTGLGLGSVVIALAAQDIAKSILAGAVILIDKPFEIGDFVSLKDYSGTVENIKFRSTRIRLLDGTLLNVPNEVLMTETIENFNRIDKRRYAINLELMLDTKLDKVERITGVFKTELEKIQSVVKDSVEVNFNTITSNGMNVFIYLYTTETAYNKYLNVTQKINLKIMEILEQEGVSLAYNSQDIYVRNVK